MKPLMFPRMSGLLDLTIIWSEIEALGQGCQSTDASAIRMPIGMSCAATRTSSLSSGAAWTTGGGKGGGGALPLFNMT